MTVLQRLPDRARVAIVRLRSLGDCVLTTPAVEILKQYRPDVEIAVVVEDRFTPVFEGNDAVAALLAPEVGVVRAWRPELCLNLHGGTRSAALTVASGAPLRAGFAHFRFPKIYNVRIPRAQEILGVDRTVHTAEHLASAMFYLGVPRTEIPQAHLIAKCGAGPLACGRPSGRPSQPGQQIGQGADRRPGGLPHTAQPYAVIHPVASSPDKTWPADRFLAVASQLGVEPIFIGGPGDDLSAFHPYRSIAGAPLSEIKTLLAHATLFLGNDSGPAHMAAAFGLPTVVLFGPSNPDIWRPWKTPAETLVSADITGISTDQVLAALARLGVPA